MIAIYTTYSTLHKPGGGECLIAYAYRVSNHGKCHLNNSIQ